MRFNKKPKPYNILELYVYFLYDDRRATKALGRFYMGEEAREFVRRYASRVGSFKRKNFYAAFMKIYLNEIRAGN